MPESFGGDGLAISLIPSGSTSAMWGCKSSHTSHFQPILSALPIPDETTSSLAGGVDSVVFVVKENRKSFSRERGVELRIGWLCLFLLALLGVCRGGISFLKSSLSSL